MSELFFAHEYIIAARKTPQWALPTEPSDNEPSTLYAEAPRQPAVNDDMRGFANMKWKWQWGRFFTFVALSVAFVTFIMSVLALAAGTVGGFMEDYAIVRLNTTMVGYNLVDSDNKIKGTKKNIKDYVDDKGADKLGIDEWYSVHLLRSCQGEYEPDARASHPELEVKKCTSYGPGHRFELDKILDQELGDGPAKLKLSDINWSSGLQSDLDRASTALRAMFALYVLSVAFTGLSVIGNAFALWKINLRRVGIVNLIIATLSFLTLLTISIALTLISTKVARQINLAGKPVGISATGGAKVTALAWAGAVVTLICKIFWLVRVCRRKKRQAKAAVIEGQRAVGDTAKNSSEKSSIEAEREAEGVVKAKSGAQPDAQTEASGEKASGEKHTYK